MSIQIVAPIALLVLNNKRSITASAVYGTQLFFGLNDGSLMVYDIKDDYGLNQVSKTPNDHSSKKVDRNVAGTDIFEDYDFSQGSNFYKFKKEVNKIVDKPIDQLEILPDMNFLVILSNGLVSIFKLDDFTLEEKLVKFKHANLVKSYSNIIENGLDTNLDESYIYENSDEDYSDTVSLAAVNSEFNLNNHTTKEEVKINDYRSYLCIAFKRKLMVYSFVKNEFNSKIEYNLNDKVKNLSFLSTELLLIVTIDNNFYLLNLYEEDERFIKKLPFFTTSVVNSTSFSYFNKSNSVKISLLKTLPHINIISKESVGLKINDNGEYINYNHGRKKAISMKNFNRKNPLLWLKKPDIIKYWFPYLVLSYGNEILEIRNLENGNLIQSIAIRSNIKDFVLIEGNYLIIITDDGKIHSFSQVTYDSQLDQFEKINKIDEAISLVEKLPSKLFKREFDEDLTEKDEKFLKLREYQIRYAEILFHNKKYEQAMYLFISFMAPPDIVISLFPPIVKGISSNNDDNDNDDSNNNNNNDALLINLEDINIFNENDAFGDMTLPSPISGRYSPTTAETSTVSENNGKKIVERQKLIESVRSLIPYLADARRKLSKLLSPDSSKFEWKGITISKRLYIPLKHQHEHQHESEQDQDQNQNIDKTLLKLAEQVDTVLFRCYLISSPGLIGPLLRVNNYCDISTVEKNLTRNQMYKELIDFYHGKNLHEKSLKLLKRLSSEQNNGNVFEGPIATVQYLQKLNNNDIGLIFEYIQWPIEVDYNYGKEIFINDSIESESLDKFRVLEFLENLKNISNELNKLDLIETYLEHIIDELNDQTTKFHTKLAELYLKHLELNKNDKEIWDKLEKFLQISNYYDFTKILKLIDGKQNYLIMKTSVLSKLSRHDEVFNILIYECGEYDMALNYCLKFYEKPEQNEKLGNKLLSLLLSKYLDPLPSVDNAKEDLYFNKALEILSSPSGLCLDFLELLTKLSNAKRKIPISQISNFLKLNLNQLTKELNRSIINGNSLKLSNTKLKLTRSLTKNESIIITETSKCSMCKKKLGYSVLSWFPDGTVVHYGCSKLYKQQFDDKNQ
ncbi:hypothetical protein PACTADRAFT_47953 [Pachysolen tannophilus NRRL Y-2460]|uniref:CNH domain-containing protein n=1 Tax=Pachysolen tannophilus NRRL Y-2460 TaxID=669874 RepID=A0A1E4U2B5_PACTA|nr:hypothetical protein PACTADRAFT_47953 [Pachysolen tannophilus NRRL Y-2460]